MPMLYLGCFSYILKGDVEKQVFADALVLDEFTVLTSSLLPTTASKIMLL